MLTPGMPEVPIPLKVKPELRTGAEGFAESKGRSSGHPPPSVHDLVEPCPGPAEVPGKLHLCHAQGPKEFLEQHLSGVCGRSFFRRHDYTAISSISLSYSITGAILRFVSFFSIRPICTRYFTSSVMFFTSRLAIRASSLMDEGCFDLMRRSSSSRFGVRAFRKASKLVKYTSDSLTGFNFSPRSIFFITSPVSWSTSSRVLIPIFTFLTFMQIPPN